MEELLREILAELQAIRRNQEQSAPVQIEEQGSSSFADRFAAAKSIYEYKMSQPPRPRKSPPPLLDDGPRTPQQAGRRKPAGSGKAKVQRL